MMATDQEVLHAMMNGIKFGGAKKDKKEDPSRVKTKAKGKAYKTGSHRSGAARHKAEIRQRVKNRPTQRKSGGSK